MGYTLQNMNVRHLKPKMDEMKILLDSANCIDVFGLCETFLTETTDNDALSISGYKINAKIAVKQIQLQIMGVEF